MEEKVNLMPGKQAVIEEDYYGIGNTITVTDAKGTVIASYTKEVKDVYNVPETTKDMPNFKKVQTAQELYMEGVHVFQYRDPAILPDSYWKEAVLRDPDYYPAHLALADFYYRRGEYSRALEHANKGLSALTHYNKRTPTGEAYYKIGLILNKMGKTDLAYDNFWKASWNMDFYAAAMTQIAAIDGKRKDYDKMAEHSTNALMYNCQNPVALSYNALADIRLGNNELASSKLYDILDADPLNHLARFLSYVIGDMTKEDFYDGLKSDPSQTCLDIAFNLCDAGACDLTKQLLEGLIETKSYVSPMVYYVLGQYDKAAKTELLSSFPFRLEEKKVLLDAIANNDKDAKAWYYYGCLEYDKNEYELARDAFLKAIEADPKFYIPYRNLAALNYSHFKKYDEVLPLLEKAIKLSPKNQQLVYETAFVMGKLGIDPKERIKFIEKNVGKEVRDDIYLEWARAYNQNDEPEKALELLASHNFVPCEGGEHANAEQFMIANHIIGRKLFEEGKFEEALKYFETAQVLPDNLGAGLWNECRLVPHQYYQALCLDALGRSDEAVKIYEHILCLKIDYFSEMHLRELPFYLAKAHKRMGNELEGRALINDYLREWNLAIKAEDAGFFGTTPFFMSFCDDAKTAREGYYSYMLGFIHRYIGNEELSQEYFDRAVECDPSNLNYMVECDFN